MTRLNVGSPILQEFLAGSVPDRTQQNTFPEQNLKLPWALDPVTSWLDYGAWVVCNLDAGMALHKPLPQTNPTPDTLARVAVDFPLGDSDVEPFGGVNLNSAASGTDVIQRMATSTYYFILLGFGWRAGYQIPIPGLVAVGNSPTTPAATQRAYNVIVSNLPGGIPLWYAQWELHYYVTGIRGSQTQAPVPFNPALHIRPDAQLPQTISLPVAPTDQRHRPGSSTLTTLPGQFLRNR